MKMLAFSISVALVTARLSLVAVAATFMFDCDSEE